MLGKKIGWKFDNTYSSLSQSMLSKLNPTPVKTPELVLFNHDLSKEIDLDFSQVNNKELALIFSGKSLFPLSTYIFNFLFFKRFSVKFFNLPFETIPILII